MEFFENQVGEVRSYLTGLPDPIAAADVPPITPGSSASPSGALTLPNPALHGDPLSVVAASSSAHSPHSLSAQRTQSRHGNSRVEKKPKKTTPAATRRDMMPSPSPAATQAPMAGAKRKNPVGDADDDENNDDESQSAHRSGPQQRSKRNRYISIACNECKRRKIKCNGETPCGRCGHLNLQCLYAPNCCATSVKDSDEFKRMAAQVNHLQEQVELLFNNLNSLRVETFRPSSVYQPERALTGPSASSTPSSTTMTLPPPPRQPPFAFRGPTSNHFTLDVAKNTLHKMGYSYPSDNGDGNGLTHETPNPSPRIPPQILPPVEGNPTTDPLWDLDREQMLHLCRIYEEEVGIMYPILRIEAIVSHAKTVATWIETAKKTGFASGFEKLLHDPNTLLLKIVMCGGLLVEGHGSNEHAERLFLSIKGIANKMLMGEAPNIQTLPFLALVAGYYFLTADEVLCWRHMGQVVRLCLELGLHRRSVIERIQDEEERKAAVQIFWSVYVLDRRWAFIAGLPYVVADEEIDPDLPRPEHPFLQMMAKYTQLSGKVWRHVRQFDNNRNMDMKIDHVEELDTLIKKWYNGLPKDAQLEISDWEEMPEFLSPPETNQKEYDIQRLKIWTWLRYNQIRMWLLTPILHTHSSIMDHLRQAEVAVKLAKNTIRYLAHLNNTTNVYRKLQVFYHQFLSSAITILFVASCHAPVNFSATCREEFYMALELLKDMSAKSWISRRLWSMVKSLRDVAPRLGLSEDPHSSAAVTMAGLASGHNPQRPSTMTGPFVHTPAYSSSPESMHNNMQMSNEMSRIFEGVSIKHNQMHEALDHVDVLSPPMGMAAPTMPYGPPRTSLYPPFRDSGY